MENPERRSSHPLGSGVGKYFSRKVNNVPEVLKVSIVRWVPEPSERAITTRSLSAGEQRKMPMFPSNCMSFGIFMPLRDMMTFSAASSSSSDMLLSTRKAM